VGYTDGTTFKDPTNPVNLPIGASYNLSTHVLTVATRSAVTLDAFDFETSNIEVHLRGSSEGGGGSLTITNSKFKLGDRSALFSLIRSDPDAGTLTVRYNKFDGNGANNTTFNDALIVAGPLVFEYNYVVHIPFDGYNPIGSPLSGTIPLLKSRFNCYYAASYSPAAHFDTHQLWGTTISNVEISFNTMFQPVVADDGTRLGLINSFVRIGDLNGGICNTPEISYNTITGPGQYANVMQLTTHDSGGTINTPSVVSNYIDAGRNVIKNTIFYPSSVSRGGIVNQNYKDNRRLDSGAIIPPA
jgi:hypothetical protein